MKRHVILYARTPRYGRVKTRLAKDVGKLAALRFYKETLNTVSRRMAKMPGTRFHIALTPNNDVDNGPGPLFDTSALLKQPVGDLGARMAGTFRDLEHGPAIIIGSDIPEIKGKHIEQAFKALTTHDAVFGPCEDGGYWLVGLKHPNRAPHVFMKNVRWSSKHTLYDTIQSLPKRWQVAYINQLDDIDDGAALAVWQKKQRK